MFDIDLKRYRVVDVSLKVASEPGGRRLELRRYTFPVDGSFGYEVDTVTHLGTHIEASAHYYDRDGEDVTVRPAEFFMGPFVNLRFDVPPRGDITRQMMEGATAGIDLGGKIVAISSPHFRHDLNRDQRAVLCYDATTYLVQSGIRIMGFDDSVTIDTSAELAQKTHHALFDNGILILEYMGQLDELHRKESYIIALPLRVVGFDSSPVRAVVIEEC